MKPIALVFCVLAAMSVRVKAQNIDNPPIQVECVTNWCEVVQGPSGTYPYTNIIVGPGTNVCLYTWICAWPEMDWRCDTNVLTLSRWAPETTNCPPQRWTNTVCPEYITNWWVVHHPGYSNSGPGVYVPHFAPSRCGVGSITFYGVWTNSHPCGYTNASYTNAVGLTVITTNFTVKEGLQRIIAHGNGIGPLWSPDWIQLLGGVLADLQQSPFGFSSLPSFTMTSFTNHMLFCCNCNIGGSGEVNQLDWRLNISETSIDTAVSLSLLDALPAWVATAVGMIHRLFSNETNLLNSVMSLINATAGFTAHGQASITEVVNFSDECAGCYYTQLTLGRSIVHLNGKIKASSDTSSRRIHVIALTGHVHSELRAWAQYIGPASSLTHWYTQRVHDYRLYSATLIDQYYRIHYWLPYTRKSIPNPSEPVSVCLGKHFLAH